MIIASFTVDLGSRCANHVRLHHRKSTAIISIALASLPLSEDSRGCCRSNRLLLLLHVVGLDKLSCLEHTEINGACRSRHVVTRLYVDRRAVHLATLLLVVRARRALLS